MDHDLFDERFFPDALAPGRADALTPRRADRSAEMPAELLAAPIGLRLVNFVVDAILNAGIALLATALVWPFLLGSNFFRVLHLIRTLDFENISLIEFLFATLPLLTFFVTAYATAESAFGGKSVGKLITGTRAVRLDGGRLTGKQVFLRALIRCIPLTPLSALWGKPWHDRWTSTTVVRD